ncbi:MAG: ATP-dependent DNA helicase, partial [Thermoprotei archaeon]
YSIVQTCEWLVYAASELARLLGMDERFKELRVLRERVKHGVKAELLELTSIEGIGRVRARALYAHGFRSLLDIVKADERELARVPGIGPILARKLKEAVTGGKPVPKLSSRRGLDEFLTLSEA